MMLADEAHRTLDRITYAVLATVSADGRPWNAPLYVAFDRRAFYWSSHRDAQHSRNIAVNPSVMLVVFDSTLSDASGHGVYVRASAHELIDAASIERALLALAARRNEPVRPVDDFRGPHAQRVYEAVTEEVWTNVLQRQGVYYFDQRVPIELEVPDC
jgi:nitroimidazol reductase NimA-like FMN-containing flavoprotein (pyridoxamine 5'-phosphate oxidase superfamily)